MAYFSFELYFRREAKKEQRTFFVLLLHKSTASSSRGIFLFETFFSAVSAGVCVCVCVSDGFDLHFHFIMIDEKGRTKRFTHTIQRFCIHFFLFSRSNKQRFGREHLDLKGFSFAKMELNRKKEWF